MKTSSSAMVWKVLKVVGAHDRSGAITFLALWYTFYQYVRIGSLEPWSAFVGAMILAAVFGYRADFHGYKWLIDRFVKHGLSGKQGSES